MLRIAVSVAAAALVLSGCGSEDAPDPSKEATKQANQIIRDARADIREERKAARRELERAREKAERAREDAAAERRRLQRLEREAGGVEEQIARNSFPGEGTFVVGEDIDPGVYRAEASPGCYWARLNSLDTSDIIDNNNADGPVVIEILATDRAVTVNRCAEFKKAG